MSHAVDFTDLEPRCPSGKRCFASKEAAKRQARRIVTTPGGKFAG